MSVAIIQYPAEELRTVSAPVEAFDSTLNDLQEALKVVTRESGGFAVAAPQIGVQQRVWWWKHGSREGLVVNPVVMALSDDLWTYWEGCLSIPDRFWYVNRPSTVTISYQDVGGKKQVMTEDGVLGRMILHELDHLNGVLIVDHLSKHEKKQLHRELGM